MPPPNAIQLTMPSQRSWQPVVRLVLGGVGDRCNLGFDDLDDLQLAVERLLAEAGSQGTIDISIEILDRGVRARIGPLFESAVADALQGPEPRTGELTLRRVLETVVDSFGVEESEDGQIVVRVDKVVRGR